MTIELRSLDALDKTVVLQKLSEAIARISEDNASMDLRQGVFLELLVYYHAVLSAQTQANIDDYESARSLLDITESPDDADPALVDQVLSNFRTVRQPGQQAAGEVVIVVSADISVTIGIGTIFTANGKQFAADSTFTAKIEEAQVIQDTDRLLTQTADGNWAFTIAVTAVEEGSDSEVKQGTAVIPAAFPPNYVTSYAASDFVGGYVQEDNQELLTKMHLGMSGKTMAGRLTMQATLREVEAFSRILRSSIIGLGDAEMLRDKHSIFQLAMGGRGDWYIRSQEQVFRQALEKTAVLIEKDTDGFGIWQMSILRDDAPGFYRIENIRLSTSENVLGGFTILEDIRDNDLTGTGFIPDILTVEEGAYSRYQTAVIRFKDTVTSAEALALGAQQDYQCDALCMPLIGEVQDYINDRQVHHHGGDDLVKAPIPCFVKITFKIFRQSGSAEPDTASIKAAIATMVNNIDFIGRLYASNIHEVIHRYLPTAASVGGIDIFCSLRYPSGYIRYLRSNEVITVPEDETFMVSPRTVQFFVSPEDVGVSVETTVPSNV